MLSEKLNAKIIDELSATLMYITYYFQGEPYLNPSFLDMVAYASSKKIYTATSTNAHYLSSQNCIRTVQSGLKKLIISVDGVEQASYEKYRIGGQLSKVLEGTKELVKTKRTMNSNYPKIIWQFIVFEHNEQEVSQIQALGKKIGVDEIQIKTAQIYDFEERSVQIPSNPKWSRYEEQQGQYVIKNKLLNKCWRMWSGAVITWDGDVVPCCFDKDAKHKMGNVLELTFGQIWNDERYQNFRYKLFQGRKEIDICQNCTEGTKVWA
jgi:radical SAM protein with 4Fe4S-binding SPASM domain